MDHQFVLSRLLDYLENQLPKSTQEEFEAHLAACSECRDVYKQYRSIMGLEKAAAAQQPVLLEDLSASVMQRIDKLERRDRQEPPPREKYVVGGLLATNGLLLAFLVLIISGVLVPGPLVRENNFNPFAGMKAGNQMLQNAAFTGEAAPRRAQMPSGYQPMTLYLESPAGVEQLLRDDALVDIKCNYREGAQQHEAVVSEMVRVLSVNFFNTQTEAAARKKITATFLVPEADARRIELARLLGNLTLTIVTPEVGNGEETKNKLTLYDPSGRPVANDISPSTIAVMYEPNPKTGNRTRRVFENGRWREGKGVELLAF